MNEKVLIVDDEHSIRFGLTRLLEQAGYSCYSAASASEALGLFTEKNPSIVLLDLRLPDMDGIGFLRKLKDADNYVAVIIMTAYGTIETAVNALKSGAENFLTKPIDPDGLIVLLRKTIENQESQRRSDYLKFQQESLISDFYMGKSEKLKKVYEYVRLLADNDSTVLILGETGTGKGLYARMIHNMSGRASQNFVEVNCAGFSRELLESELFGYDKGAFTGAVGSKPGLFELANRGTLFLDEIGEMQWEVQAKLLKVIEDKRFRRLGGVHEKLVDVRIITASNRDLSAEVKKNRFREDLFFRLNVMNILVPPLRELQEDIIPLSEYFLDSVCQRQGKQIGGFSSEAKQALTQYSWPGNIREMCNLIERSVILTRNQVIQASDLQLGIVTRQPPQVSEVEVKSLEEMEKEHIQKTLAACKNNLSKTARVLGITRRTLYNKIRQFKIS